MATINEETQLRQLRSEVAVSGISRMNLFVNF